MEILSNISGAVKIKFGLLSIVIFVFLGFVEYFFITPQRVSSYRAYMWLRRKYEDDGINAVALSDFEQFPVLYTLYYAIMIRINN